jgi:hypothetical protein
VQFNASGNNNNYAIFLTNGSDTSNTGISASLLWSSNVSKATPWNPANVATNVELASAIFGAYVPANSVNVNTQAVVNLNVGVVNLNNATEKYWIFVP